MTVCLSFHLKVLSMSPLLQLIWGVVCSKSVVHESMADPLKDASIMIVAGSVEYERVQGRLSTLEPILNQEGEFLSKQVGPFCRSHGKVREGCLRLLGSTILFAFLG